MIIDANMYWLPKEIFENEKLKEKFIESAEKYGINIYEKELEDKNKYQIVVEKPEGSQNLNYVDGDYEIEKQLQDMEDAGVDKAILKLPGCQEWLTVDMCKLFNSQMAEHVKKSNGKFYGLGVVPPYGTKENIEELHRCIKELGFSGIQLISHYGDKYLDDEEFDSFFKEVNELNIPVYIHHNPLPVQYDKLLDYNNLRRSYGRITDQVTAVGREIFSGMFEKYTNLKFIHSMLGGGFFALSNIMFPMPNNRNVKQNKDAVVEEISGEDGTKKGIIKEDVARFQTDNEKNLKYLKENIFFEMSHAQPWGKVQLECAVKILGGDKIIFGTSYPVKKEWLLDGVECVNSLDITNEDKKMILGENAKKIYNLK